MLALLGGVLAGVQANKMVTLQMVFLRPVPGTNPLTKNVQAITMQRHIQGLEALWQQGTALAVGPMESPDYEGMLVLNVPTKEEAMAIMAKDPFVKLGYLKADILPWMCENVFQKGKTFMDVEKVWFGILERPQNAPQYPAAKLSELQKGHLANIGKMANDGLLASAGPFLTDEKRRGVFIFCTHDQAAINRAVAVDPLIKAKRLELKLMPWYVTKGTIVPYKAAN